MRRGRNRVIDKLLTISCFPFIFGSANSRSSTAEHHTWYTFVGWSVYRYCIRRTGMRRCWKGVVLVGKVILVAGLLERLGETVGVGTE